ncbi:hypothetical protein ACT4RZ_09720 [Ornithobacterium rhinotracheale]
MENFIQVPEGCELIFRRYRIGKNGERIYPKNGKAFPIIIKKK